MLSFVLLFPFPGSFNYFNPTNGTLQVFFPKHGNLGGDDYDKSVAVVMTGGDMGG